MKNMIRRFFGVLVIALAMTAIFTSGVNAQNISEEANLGGNGSQKLEGTWQTVVTFPDEFSLKVLFTFMPGRDETEGTLVDQNEYQLTPGPVCTADQGVWKRTGTRTFIATHYAFCFDADADFEPAGTIKVRDEIELNLKGTMFTGRQYIEIFDVDGELTDTFEAEMEGTRVTAEAPPTMPLQSPRSLRERYQKYYRSTRKN